MSRGVGSWISSRRATRALSEKAFAQVGEVSEGWLRGVSKEARDALEKELGEVTYFWLARNNLLPSFAPIVENTQHVAPNRE